MLEGNVPHFSFDWLLVADCHILGGGLECEWGRVCVCENVCESLLLARHVFRSCYYDMFSSEETGTEQGLISQKQSWD